MHRYFLTEGEQPEREVTKTEWVAAERRAGFRNTLGQPDEPGTASFSTTVNSGTRGRIDYDRELLTQEVRALYAQRDREATS